MIQKIEVGQIWKIVENRLVRYVKIIAVDDGSDKVKIKTCTEDGQHPTKAPLTRASKWRFDGKRGGYSFVKATH
jgi:hypothetical protein